MIRLIFLFGFLGFCSLAFAQEHNFEKQAQQETKALVKLYQLDKEQKNEILAIQERHFQAKAAISSLKSDNYKVYLYKLKAIREGSQYAIGKVLREDQLPLFEAEQVRLQQAYLQKLATLKAGGASKEALELAKITIE